jgi:hypothetical protein
MEKPNDRVLSDTKITDDEVDPKIYLIINNEKFLRPGLETYYAKPNATQGSDSSCSCDPVMGAYCECNMVCTCNPQCSCNGQGCSCNSHHSSGGSYCSCVPVH